MKLHVLIDTDILLDCCLNREPYISDSIKILQLCELQKIQGYTTPVILSNLFYILRKNNSLEKVKLFIENLLKLLKVVDMNQQVVSEALVSGLKDFEDAMQYFSAVQHPEISILLTRNRKDFEGNELSILSPSELLSVITTQA